MEHPIDDMQKGFYRKVYTAHTDMVFDEVLLRALTRDDFVVFCEHFYGFRSFWEDCDFDTMPSNDALATVLFDPECRDRLILWQVCVGNTPIAYVGYRDQAMPTFAFLPLSQDLDWELALEDTEIMVAVLTAFFEDTDWYAIHLYPDLPLEEAYEERLSEMGFERHHFYDPEIGDTPEGRKRQTWDKTYSWCFLLSRRTFVSLFFEEDALGIVMSDEERLEQKQTAIDLFASDDFDSSS